MATIEESKKQHIPISDFIISVDEDERLILIPYSDFLKKFNNLDKEEQIKVLYELDFSLECGEISSDYLRHFQLFKGKYISTNSS